MEPLNEREHEELNQAVKSIIYFARRRQLNENEQQMIEWAKLWLNKTSDE